MPQPPVHHLDQALAYIFNPLVLRHDLGALHEYSQLLRDLLRLAQSHGGAECSHSSELRFFVGHDQLTGRMINLWQLCQRIGERAAAVTRTFQTRNDEVKKSQELLAWRIWMLRCQAVEDIAVAFG